MKKQYLFFRHYRKNINGKFHLYVICSFISKICLLLIPYLTKVLVDKIQLESRESFIKISFYLLFIMIIFSLSISLSFYLENYINTYALNRLKEDLMKKIFLSHYIEVGNFSSGEFIQRIFIDTEIIKPLVISIYVDTTLNIIYIISIIIIMSLLNKTLTIILVIIIPIFLLCYKFYIPHIERTSKDIIKADEKLKSLSEEIINGRFDIKINNAHSFITSKIKEKLSKYFKASIDKTKYFMVYDYILVIGLMNLATLSIYCFGGYLAFENIITIGTLISFTLYFSRVWTPMEYFMELSKEFKVQKISMDRIYNILNLKYEDKLIESKLTSFKILRLENISLSINEKKIFNNLNLVIKEGDKIAIRGSNGAGKSTLANIIIKLIDPSQGYVYYNGINYRDINAKSIRNKIILIPSKVFMFSESIDENIFLGSNRDGEIRKTFLNENKLVQLFKDNNIGLNNRKVDKLSGGEKKIIQILRGLFLDGDVYILDEPFNFIDNKYKEVIIDFIKNNLENKTIIIISHYESIFKCCNKIYNLENGKLTKN